MMQYAHVLNYTISIFALIIGLGSLYWNKITKELYEEKIKNIKSDIEMLKEENKKRKKDSLF